MNSEELELSLRTEFEIYLKNAHADLRREAAEFQNRVESELERQKTQFAEVFNAFSARLDAEPDFGEAFRGSVAEHLRLARDEGARVAATAMEEAAEMARESEPPPPPPRYDEIRDAIKDISSKDSQSAILKSLVAQAKQFAPRGAFFIIKSEHFVGWKVFGAAADAESAIREIHFPTSADSVLGTAANSRATVDAQVGEGDAVFLDPLQFGRPDQMLAIPLVARHRTVAVLYADHGNENEPINREALETLVNVAGLTVELLASMQAAKAENRPVTADFEETRHDGDEVTPAFAPSPVVAEEVPAAEHARPTFEETPPMTSPAFDEAVRSPYPAFTPAAETSEFKFSESVAFEGGFPAEAASQETIETRSHAFEIPPPPVEAFIAEEKVPEPPVEERAIELREAPEPERHAFDTAKTDPDMYPDHGRADHSPGFGSGGSIEPAAIESSPFEAPAAAYEPAAAVSGTGFGQVAEPVVEMPVQQQPHLSDRHVDLPIQVADEERRIHNDARRFARLLVSEIKLYNEKKVIEGREAGDLYERLREAIDRSREMYDKRVQPPVAAKFDYFHYEVVNALAEGDAQRLGPNYPGSVV